MEVFDYWEGARSRGVEQGWSGAQPPVNMEAALAYRRLVIVGDPGAGKTTFLRRIAFELCEFRLAGGANSIEPLAKLGIALHQNNLAPTFLIALMAAFLRSAEEDKHSRVAMGEKAGTEEPLFPILIRVATLYEHIRSCRERRGNDGPTTEDSPAWLLHFLKAQSEEQAWGLDEAYFCEKLDQGQAILLFDGLDELPGRREREEMARLFEKTTPAYHRCRFVVTTRPLTYRGRATLEGFQPALIEPLEPGAVQRFLEHWCRALFSDSPNLAEEHLAELNGALRDSPEIQRMALNPVMLTALAVVHWNERRLPEQRADLYQSILNWLARSRERRAGRAPADRCLALLEHLALRMQDHPKGHLVQVSKGEATGILAPQFPAASEGERLRQAQAFLAQEEVDSGIIVSRGSEIQFGHLTFQEYLAAKAISGLGDRNQYDLLLAENKIYRQDWREVALLLAGVLGEQGKPKVDGLISAMLARLDEHVGTR